MISESYLPEDGNAWERRVKTWLRLRYPGGMFEEVPADHHGDFGVEGFSRDGIAYQCYAPRGRLKPKDLYENQKKKINEDIGKFINNKDDLLRLFGSLLIGSWWLVVPEHRSAKLVQHATEKALLVRGECLPYATENFYIHIATGKDFEVERQAAIRKGVEALQLEETEVADTEVQDWVHGQSELALPQVQRPRDIVSTAQMQDEAIQLQTECSEYINDIFWSVFADRWASLPQPLMTTLEGRFKTPAQRVAFFG